jgi:hypothetical protein
VARVTLFSMTVFCAFFPKVMQRPEALLRIRAFSASPNTVGARSGRTHARQVGLRPAMFSTSIWFESMKSFSLQTSLKKASSLIHLVSRSGRW